MMRTLMLLALLSVPLSASPKVWKDGNGVLWTPLPIKSNFHRTFVKCRELGMRLPSAADLLDAIEYGLFDPKKNWIFAKEIHAYDWMWVSDPPVLSANWMVSRQGDTAADQWTERHYGLCRK